MTGYPEAVLAAELALPYAAVALVTDYDAGVDGAEPVTQEAVFAFFERNVDRVRELLRAGHPSPAVTVAVTLASLDVRCAFVSLGCDSSPVSAAARHRL